MKIIYNTGVESTEFKYLVIGDLFLYDDTVYIKTNNSRDVLNAVDLKTGQAEVIDYRTKVIEVEGKLIISSKCKEV